jgi:hypothetical protein
VCTELNLGTLCSRPMQYSSSATAPRAGHITFCCPIVFLRKTGRVSNAMECCLTRSSWNSARFMHAKETTDAAPPSANMPETKPYCVFEVWLFAYMRGRNASALNVLRAWTHGSARRCARRSDQAHSVSYLWTCAPLVDLMSLDAFGRL